MGRELVLLFCTNNHVADVHGWEPPPPCTHSWSGLFLRCTYVVVCPRSGPLAVCWACSGCFVGGWWLVFGVGVVAAAAINERHVACCLLLWPAAHPRNHDS